MPAQLLFLRQSKRQRILRGIVVICAVVSESCSGANGTPTSPTAGSTSFYLTGSVRDSVLRPVIGARVEIATDPLAGRFTNTDANGQFSFSELTPATDIVNLIVTKAGYSPVTAPARNNRSTLVTLTASTLIQLEGEYQVTFTAANTCSAIPSELRRRTYPARIARPTNVTNPSSASVVIELGGADFYFGYGSFSGLVADDAVRLSVYSWDAFYKWLEDHPVIEQYDSTTYLSFIGTAIATGARPDAPIAAVLDGTVSYCPSAKEPTRADFPPTCSVPVIDCRSNEHQVSLRRR